MASTNQSLDPTDSYRVDNLFAAARSAARSGRRTEARRKLWAALKLDPNRAELWIWLAGISPSLRAAESYLERALDLEPHNSAAREGLEWVRTRMPSPTLAVLPDVTAAELELIPAELSKPEESLRTVEEPLEVTALVRPVAVQARRTRWSLAGVLAFVGRRLSFGLLVILAIIFMSYLGLDMAGGADLTDAAGQAASRTVSYLSRVLQGDLGLSTVGGETYRAVPVAGVITERLPRSLGLLAVALLGAAALGTGLGVLAARGRSQQSLVIILATLIGVSVPSFFAAFLLQWALTTITRQTGRAILPAGGFGWDSHLLLPALVLAARPVAQITRIAFVSVRQAMEQDFVRTARSKGLRRRTVLSRHVMRNAAIPILTTIGVSLRYSLSSLPVVELYFGWPGAGFTLLKAIAARDDNLTVALVLCLGVFFVLINLLLELGYRAVDPRLWEREAKVARRHREKPIEIVKSVVAELRDWLGNNWLVNRLRGSAPLSLRPMERGLGLSNEVNTLSAHRQTVGAALIGNLPFTVGGLLVVGLVLILFLGPLLTPNNPFHVQGLTMVDGKFTVPPFPPGEGYPWGTDMLGRGLLSLILAGAQQTLTLAVLAVGARLVVGVLLGAIAGWNSGGRLDSLILGLNETISAFPTLLLAMIFVLALGIRLGLPPFILSLCLVGWGEIMQFVRGEVIAIRPKPFIESAEATGARTPRIISRHVLPNLFSALISIAALEMGAVLMLLGELGFISIFIGGGTRIVLPSMAVLYSDVPEWGALLSNIRYQARSYPWTGLYPMAAFFVAIVSFNLFGEGVRRMVDEGNLILNRFFNRFTLAFAVVAVVGSNWLSSNAGAIPFYKRHAGEFSGENAMRHVETLTGPEFEGRALGTAGMDLAADYIGTEFERLGLQPAGQRSSYFQERKRAFERLTDVPELVLPDTGPEPVYGQDFAAYPGLNLTMGEAAGPVRWIALGQRSVWSAGVWRMVYPDLYHADFTGDIILALSSEEAYTLASKPKNGMLVVVEDPDLLARRYTLSGRPRTLYDRETGGFTGPEPPSIWITEEIAERILEGTGHTLENMAEMTSELSIEEVLQEEIPTEVNFRVDGVLERLWPVRNVLGYIPGSHGWDLCEDCLGRQLIVVMAQYDSPPVGPEGVYAAANNNASGVAVLLEAIRVIQETEYQPRKTFLFIAYSGEGLDNGERVSGDDIEQFLQAKIGFSTQLRLEAVVQLRAVGAGTGDRLEVSAGGSLRLAELMHESAGHMRVDAVRADEAVDIGRIYDADSSGGGQDAPIVKVYWEGWEATSRLPSDTLDAVSAENLEEAGRAVAMALMVLGSEEKY